MDEDLTDISVEILRRILHNSHDIQKVESKIKYSFNVCCPIHNEKSPSCSINLPKAIYNCFACGASGSLIKLYKETTGTSIYKELGIRYNEEPFTAPKIRKISFDKIPDVHFKWNAEKIVNVNNSDAAINYVKKRGFTESVINSMEMQFALKANAEDTINTERSISFDNRLIIPVYEYEKKSDYLTIKHLLTMEGRDVFGEESFKEKMKSLGKTCQYKKCIYPVGSSSNTLYQWQKLDTHKTLYFTEGLMDVAAMRTSSRMQNSTSTFGSAISERQYFLLKKFDDIVYIINNDAAGWKSFESMKKNFGKEFRVLVPPAGCKDVNDIIIKLNKTIDQVIDQNWLSYIMSSDNAYEMLMRSRKS